VLLRTLFQLSESTILLQLSFLVGFPRCALDSMVSGWCILTAVENVLAWRDEFNILKDRLEPLFVRPEPRRQTALYLEALLSGGTAQERLALG
jgi:hypothetical protein